MAVTCAFTNGIVVSQLKDVPPANKTLEAAPRLDLLGEPLPQGAVARIGSVPRRFSTDNSALILYTPDGKNLATFDGAFDVYL